MISETQRSIIKLMAEGYGDKEIADRLHMSETTLRYHLKKCWAEMAISPLLNARIQICRWAIRNGLIEA